jgi:arabinofuranan 3-O-arabinosyltransferase
VLALVDGDPATAWVAASSAQPATFHVAWPGERTVHGVALALSATAPAVPARTVVVSGGGSSRRVVLDQNGDARFRPLHARRLTIRVVDDAPGYAVDAGTRTPLPLGVGELEVLGPREDDLVDAAGTPLRGRCGTGPTVQLGEQDVPTRYRAVLGRTTDDVTLSPCGREVTLPSGTVHVVAAADDLLAVDHIGLEASAPGRPPVPLATGQWGDRSRTIEVPEAGSPRLLVVSQNDNAGWRATLDGTTLTAQEVDGWRQGWWLPAGTHGTVRLTFTPQPWYVAGLVVGVLGVVVALLLLLLRSRGEPRAPTVDAGAVPLLVVLLLMAGVGGLLAGWWGAVAAVVVTVLRRIPGAATHTWVVGPVGVLVAGAVTALARVDHGLTNSELTQLLLVASLSAVVPAPSPADPPRPSAPKRRVFSRRKGLSMP